MKNIRQAYKELEERYKELAEAHLILQRTLKRVILTAQRDEIAIIYSHYVARYYTDQELDEMQIEITDNKGSERMELSI